MIKLTNTLTGQKEELIPSGKDGLTFYACGITPSGFAHLGHGRCYVLFDVLYRFLKSQNQKVTYCRNITDIDDKLLQKAEDLGDRHRYQDVAETYLNAFFEDMESLNCLFPDHQPRATEVIPDIIHFIEILIKKGHAYAVEGDVYFDVQSSPEYGKLSKRNLDDLKAGARVEINTKKKNPTDFALWKSEPQGEFWNSPWGFGRPGWHIECSVMATKFLGNTIDIHSGGMDLIFPHHENEIAQSEGVTGVPFVKNWMHVAFVRIEKEKMSKSTGNFYTLRDVFDTFDPMVVRFYILKHHYRSPMDFSMADLEAAEKAYRKLCKAFNVSEECKIDMSLACSLKTPVMCKMINFVQDDLNTVGMWGIVFENLDTLGDELCTVKAFIQNVLGLSLDPLPEKIICITPEIQTIIEEREKARAEKKWEKADMLRDKLKELGYDAQDTK
ncbi:cysteine--tRNA ligase [Candidatus Babeliales bacterium]|nr:cysteine--tRNA ligase [Candidatus Babeliales bacterium]